MHNPCVICHRDVDRPVCDHCRSVMHTHLTELPTLLAEATELTAHADRRLVYRYKGAHLGCANKVLEYMDPVSGGLPSGPTGSPGRVRVTGSRSAPLPISIELLSLVGPGSASVHDDHDDQVGELPPREWLDEVCADWAEQCGHRRPRGTVRLLARWLTLHLDWALDHHPAIEEFAAELRRHHAILSAAAQRLPQRPELCRGVECGHCQTRALWRSEGRVTCGQCGRIYMAGEYSELVAEQARGVAA